jgi:hypothetical protein
MDGRLSCLLLKELQMLVGLSTFFVPVPVALHVNSAWNFHHILTATIDYV